MIWNFLCTTCFYVRITKLCLSICLHPGKRNPSDFINISPTVVIDVRIERSSQVLQHGNPKLFFFFKIRQIEFCLEFWLRCLNHPSLVNISLGVVASNSVHCCICNCMRLVLVNCYHQTIGIVNKMIMFGFELSLACILHELNVVFYNSYSMYLFSLVYFEWLVMFHIAFSKLWYALQC